MDFPSALRTVGLDGDLPLTRDTLRRAYLRRLREHPPERDPEGFQQLRAAYELLEPYARHVEQAGRDHEPRIDREVAVPRGTPDGVPPGREVAVLRGAADGAQADRDVAVLTGAAEADGLGVAVDAGQGAAPTSSPRRAHPRPAEPVSPDDAPTAGQPPAPPHLDAPASAEPPGSLRELVARVIALLQDGRVDAALALSRRARADMLDDRRDASTAVVRRWALTRDLLGVAVVLPDSIVRALARGIATDDVGSARTAIAAYQGANPARAKDLHAQVRKHAKVLHGLIGDAFIAAPDSGAAGPRGRESKILGFPVAFAVIVLLKLFARCDAPAPTEHALDLQVPAEAVRKLRPRVEPPAVHELMDSIWTIRGSRDATKAQVEAAYSMDIAVRPPRDCDRLVAAFGALEQATLGAGSGSDHLGGASLDYMRADLTELCGERLFR